MKHAIGGWQAGGPGFASDFEGAALFAFVTKGASSVAVLGMFKWFQCDR